jgi:hypothetical protein
MSTPTYRMIVIEYGNPIGDAGAYKHPDGETCALQVMAVFEFESAEEALEIGLEYEAEKYVHEVIIEELEAAA